MARCEAAIKAAPQFLTCSGGLRRVTATQKHALWAQTYKHHIRSVLRVHLAFTLRHSILVSRKSQVPYVGTYVSLCFSGQRCRRPGGRSPAPQEGEPWIKKRIGKLDTPRSALFLTNSARPCSGHCHQHHQERKISAIDLVASICHLSESNGGLRKSRDWPSSFGISFNGLNGLAVSPACAPLGIHPPSRQVGAYLLSAFSFVSTLRFAVMTYSNSRGIRPIAFIGEGRQDDQQKYIDYNGI